MIALLRTPGAWRWVLGSVVTFLTLFLSYFRMADATRRLETARSNASEAKSLADDILRLRNRPRQASLEAESPGRIAQRISNAAKRASVALDSVRSLDPQSPRRIAESDYVSRATEIVLQDVTMRQLADFCWHLSDRGNGLVVRDVDLTSRLIGRRGRSPGRTGQNESSGGRAEAWDARLTLTQLVHSPISD